MGTKELRGRDIWQDYSGANAGVAEYNFHTVFAEHFRGTALSIRPKPQEFSTIYVDVKLPKIVLEEIYVPPDPIKKHGITPDYAIDNRELGKTLYVEVKRQDGWVEGKLRSAGRGNAHERSCKFFTPGLQKIMRAKGRLSEHALPFWTVFVGDITRDPCRVREVTCWYDGYAEHFFMWRNPADSSPLLRHFEKYLKPLLL